MSKKEERDKSDACMDAMHEQVEDMKSAEDALDYLIWLALNVVDSEPKWKEPCLTRVYARVFYRFHNQAWDDHRANIEFTRQFQVKEYKT
tara:strand:+ start:471 stop:740 length:270 start_codon:yes stop_codon:yes gene_type:complete